MFEDKQVIFEDNEKVFLYIAEAKNHSLYKEPENSTRITIVGEFLRTNIQSSFFPEIKKIKTVDSISSIDSVHGKGHLLKLRESDKICLNCKNRKFNLSCKICSKKEYYSYLNADTYCTSKTGSEIFRSVNCIFNAIKNLNIRPYSYLLIRPPGHHCSDLMKGFCIINNAIIAAKKAREYGYNKICILDWDFHHFDGTSDLLNELDLGISIHAYGKNVYPGTGHENESRENCINIPLKLTTNKNKNYYTDEIVLNIFLNEVVPIIAKYSPELIIVSNGLDMHKDDSLAGLNLTESFYVDATKILKQLCPKLLYILEGGYNPQVIKECSVKIIEELNK